MAEQNDNMETTWGSAATHAEHRVHDRIQYTKEDGQTQAGSIVWICAPAVCEGRQQPVRYIVQPEGCDKRLDLVCPGNILIEEEQQPAKRDTAASLEQALSEMLATLPIPITIRREIDDDGQPFYVWFIGESGPGYPFGLYIGTDRQFPQALKQAIETLIKHLRGEK